jgi:lysophospholipase L1-like esterase
MRKQTAFLYCLLGICLWLNGCASRKAPTIRADDYRETVRVACIGDSITYGDGVEDREKNSYPAVLNRLLGDRFEVRNFGVGGTTLLKKGDKPYWQEAAFAEAGKYNPQVVLIKLGTNDTKPQNAEHLDEFEQDLREMVRYFGKLPAQPKVWLCLPAPVYETRWGINEKTLTDEVIPSILKVAEDNRLPVIDLYAALANRPSLFPDKIHPNAAGAALIAQTIHDALVMRRK